MKTKQALAIAHYRLLQGDKEYHKKHLTIAQAESTGLWEALLKTEDYFLRTALNLHK